MGVRECTVLKINFTGCLIYLTPCQILRWRSLREFSTRNLFTFSLKSPKRNSEEFSIEISHENLRLFLWRFCLEFSTENCHENLRLCLWRFWLEFSAEISFGFLKFKKIEIMIINLLREFSVLSQMRIPFNISFKKSKLIKLIIRFIVLTFMDMV